LQVKDKERVKQMTQKITVQLPGFDKPIIIENGNMVSQESFSNKMAWGWGSVLDRYLKGIESICAELGSDRLKSTLSMSTEANVGENIKKAIDWIIEKLKMLAKLIRDFFKKVGEYLSGGKHAKALKMKDEAVKRLEKLASSQPNHEVFKRITSRGFLFAYNNARMFESANGKFGFKNALKALSPFIKEFNINNVTNDTEHDFDRCAKSIIDGLDKVKKESGKFAETNDQGDTDNYSNHALAIEMVKNYDLFLRANDSIQFYMSDFQKSIDRISASKLYNKTVVDQDDIDKIHLLQRQVSLLSNVINGLMSLGITQSIPSFDKIIDIILLTLPGNNNTSNR
jgi:tetratricopeptide (TPR) repeat protein